MDNKQSHLFDDPKNVKRFLYVLYACCALLLVGDLVFHRHTLHHWEEVTGFYAIFGFVGCVVLVLIAKKMRILIMRSESYYDSEGGNQGGNDVDV